MNYETTIRHLGGHEALYMMGCKEVVRSHNSLTLRIKSKSVRYIKIELNAILGFYNVTFYSGQMTKLTPEFMENVGWGSLKGLIESKTGLCLTL